MYRPVLLKDGTTVDVAAGSVLPADLHPDFEYYALPGESIPAAKDSHVLVRTTIAKRDVNLEHTRNRPPGQTAHVLECANRSIRNAMPGHERVHAAMLRGERRGRQKWQDLIDDMNIVMSEQLVRGDTLQVLIGVPTDPSAAPVIEVPLFFMKLDARNCNAA